MDKIAKSLVLQFLHLTVHVLIDLLDEYDFDTLRQYLQLFPEQALARLISTYLAYLGVPLSDKEETAKPSASLDDVFSAISVRLLLHPAFAPLDLAKQETESALQSSIFARRVMAEVYLQDQDYQTTITVSEAGLELVSAYRVDTGSDLILYVTFTAQKPDW
jgi:superkiller protein 3